jgi:hypothetical protein
MAYCAREIGRVWIEPFIVVLGFDRDNAAVMASKRYLLRARPELLKWLKVYT